ncbi:MAG: DUF1667 domain-containing protein [Clostridiales bacterium]|nr:DUF1667 domain-containing protein [Clostridiales bacterium]
MKLICIMCPMGCELTVTKEKNGDVKVSGNTCIRGEVYGKEEVTAPKRMLTALVKTDMGVLPVKTTKPIPKSMVFAVNDEIGKLRLKKAKSGDKIIKNVLNTGADIIVTGDYVQYDL